MLQYGQLCPSELSADCFSISERQSLCTRPEEFWKQICNSASGHLHIPHFTFIGARLMLLLVVTGTRLTSLIVVTGTRLTSLSLANIFPIFLLSTNSVNGLLSYPPTLTSKHSCTWCVKIKERFDKEWALFCAKRTARHIWYVL